MISAQISTAGTPIAALSEPSSSPIRLKAPPSTTPITRMVRGIQAMMRGWARVRDQAHVTASPTLISGTAGRRGTA